MERALGIRGGAGATSATSHQGSLGGSGATRPRRKNEPARGPTPRPRRGAYRTPSLVWLVSTPPPLFSQETRVEGRRAPQQHSVPCLPGPVGGRRRGVARHGEPGQALPRFPRLPSPGLVPVTRAHPEILLAVDKGSFQHLKKLLHKESIFLVKKF